MKRFCLISNLLLCLGVLLSVSQLTAAEKYSLKEESGAGVVFGVNTTVEIEGELQTPQEKKLLSHPLTVSVNLDYTEKRLSPAGRDARSYRAVRVYERAQSEIKVAENKIAAKLRTDRSDVAVYGNRQGMKLVSLEAPFSRNELELLQSPGDSLSIMTLLPAAKVAVGEEWSVPSYAVQMLTGTEAVVSSELTCKLEKVEGNIARISFEGQLKGATGGAQTEVELSGNYEYELEVGYLKRFDLSQTGKADPGPVHPGSDVKVKVHIERYPAIHPELITEQLLEAIPLDPTEELLELEFLTPWKMSFRHNRNWHVFQQTEKMVILRLVENGNFISQCNMQPLAPALPGKHVTEAQFTDDIQTSLGKQLKELSELEYPGNESDLKVFRVLATGTARELEMNWVYYLCAAPSGKQSSLVYSVEAKLLPRLEPQEKQLMQTVGFK